jgi:hypothetical protein
VIPFREHGNQPRTLEDLHRIDHVHQAHAIGRRA